MSEKEKKKTIIELKEHGLDMETINWIIKWLEDKWENTTEDVYKKLFKNKEVSYA